MDEDDHRPLTLSEELEASGVSRRRFLAWTARITAVLALPPALAPQIAQAVTTKAKPTIVWLNFQDCTGDTESFLRSRSPSVDELILELANVDYQETIMAPSGAQAEKSLTDAVAKGGHLVVVEGSIPRGASGTYCVIGGKTAIQRLQEAAKGAAAVITVGTCAAYGGLPAAAPNPTDAVGVSDIISGVPLINLPGCPVNADNITATLVHYLTFNALPATDDKGRPLFAYGARIHDNCPRRGHFDAGEFALAYGDDGHKNGWCLYKLGCKGPSTWHNCPTRQWNDRTNWPIGVGAPCVGCSEPAFWDTMTPISARVPNLSGVGLQGNIDQIGLALVGVAAAGATVHGIAKVVTHQRHFALTPAGPGAATVQATATQPEEPAAAATTEDPTTEGEQK